VTEALEKKLPKLKMAERMITTENLQLNIVSKPTVSKI
jgi:hypothetical protein